MLYDAKASYIRNENLSHMNKSILYGIAILMLSTPNYLSAQNSKKLDHSQGYLSAETQKITMAVGDSDIDFDGDGVLDFADLDSDNDGISDIDEGKTCTTFDLSTLDGSVNALQDFNNANLNLGGAIIKVVDPLVFYGAATLDEYSINDDHETGSFGLILGVSTPTGAPADRLQSSYTFSQPVCNFNFRIVDVDRTDEVTVYGYLNGQVVPFTISNQGICLNWDAPNNTMESICNVQAKPVNGNVAEHAFDVTFDGCIDSVVTSINDQGPGAGGSFTFIISPDPTCTGPDTDGDGNPDYLDADSDNDGIPDAIEACSEITRTLEECVADADFDITDAAGAVTTACAAGPLDTDNDGIPDFRDLDSDGDGCPDAMEANSIAVSGNVNSYAMNDPAANITTSGLIADAGGVCNTPTTNSWVDANVIPCAPLAIELKKFNATVVNNSLVRVDWITSREEDNEYFLIEVSKDNKNWRRVTRANSQGNSEVEQTYEDYDNNPFGGVSLYRLKAVDYNGKISYSETKSVLINEDIPLNVYPNPTSGIIVLEGPAHQMTEIQKVQAFNLVGQNLTSLIKIVEHTDAIIRIDLSQLPIGNYFLRMNEKTYRVNKVD